MNDLIQNRKDKVKQVDEMNANPHKFTNQDLDQLDILLDE